VSPGEGNQQEREEYEEARTWLEASPAFTSVKEKTVAMKRRGHMDRAITLTKKRESEKEREREREKEDFLLFLEE
jgi:hypothetical protein